MKQFVEASFKGSDYLKCLHDKLTALLRAKLKEGVFSGFIISKGGKSRS